MTRRPARALLSAVALVATLCPGALLAQSAPAAAAQSGPCALAFDTAAGVLDTDYYLPAEGTIHGAVLFVDYAGERAPDSELPAEERTVTEGVRERMLQLTSGKVDLRLTPFRRWYHLPGTAESYGQTGAFDVEQSDAHVRAVLRLADPDIDFSEFDVVYMVQSDRTKNVPASTASSRPAGAGVQVDGIELRSWVDVAGGVTDPADLLMEHETLHLLGLPDLYGPDSDPDAYTGGYDVMGGSLTQPELLAWQRWQLGHVADERVTCVGPGESRDVVLAPVTAQGPGQALFAVRTGRNTRLIGEWRTRDGLDAEACSTGLLLYRADDRIETAEGPYRVIDSRPRSGGCNDHELNDAPFDLQRPRYVDPSGVVVQVLRIDDDGLHVRLTAEAPAPAPSVTLSPSVISAGEVVTARWSGRPGQVVEVMSRTQPATEFSVIRTITLGTDGRAETTHRPQRNTRLTGRTQGSTTTGVAPLISVRSVATMRVLGDGDGRQVVTGRVYPARPGRIVSLYADGRLIGQARNDSTGIYRIGARLAPGLVDLQVRTGDDTYNLGARTPVEEYEIA